MTTNASGHITYEAAIALGEAAARGLGFTVEEARTIAANLVDAELSGYPALGLTRLLTVAEHPRFASPRRPIRIVHETPVSALVDGGNNVGFLAAYYAVNLAVGKARTSGLALVGLHDSWLSGRNAYYVEIAARAGFACIHTACSSPIVVPPGGLRSAFGTNPLAIGLPCAPDPVVFDMATSAINHGDVILAKRLGQLLPENVAQDASGALTRDPAAALDGGGILPFGGHRGFGLSFMIQAFGLLGGAALPQGHVQDFGYLFIVFDPGLLVPRERFGEELAALVASVKATPIREGIAPIRIPSERAYAERARRRLEGFVLDPRIHTRLAVLSRRPG